YENWLTDSMRPLVGPQYPPGASSGPRGVRPAGGDITALGGNAVTRSGGVDERTGRKPELPDAYSLGHHSAGCMPHRSDSHWQALPAHTPIRVSNCAHSSDAEPGPIDDHSCTDR